MGQEIVHCSVCGGRLRSIDFEKGEALRVDHKTYCQKCAPQILPPHSAPASSSSTRKRKTSTAHIPIITPRHAMEAVPDQGFPPLVLWGGAALVLLLVATTVVTTGRSRAAPPAVQIARRAETAPAPAPEKPPPLPNLAPAPAPQRSAAAEAAELAAIDRKTAELSAQERFGEALEALAGAKSRHDTLEWTAAIQRRSRELENLVKPLFLDLDEKATHALRRGAESEARELRERIARWNMPGLVAPAVAEKSAAPPAPAPAPPPPLPPPPAPVANEKPAPIPFVSGAMKWALLTPMKMSAGPGATLTLLEDGSVLAGGELPPLDRYAFTVQTELKGITGFRLEVLPDRSMPASGPGRAANGNFVLSEFRVQTVSDPQAASGTPVAIEHVAADFNQEGWAIFNAADGKNETGWAVLPHVGKAHEAAFELKAPLTSGTLLFQLEYQSECTHHSIGRFRISATTAKNPSSELAARTVIDPSRVEKAIQRGVVWLRNPNYPADYGWSANELILWTFLHAGMAETDPDFQKRLKEMLDGPLDRTYRVALQAMILEELDRVAYQHRIWQCAQFLVDNQCLNGQWHYGTPTEFPKGVPTPAKPPVATAARIDAEGRRIKPKVQRKLAARKTRDGPAEGDNSNSQYAALGLRACFDAGVLAPEDTVLRAIKWWRESQYFDEGKEGEYASKGWSYTSPAKDARAYHAMTAGAVSSLTIYDYMLGRDWKKNTPIKAGVNWLSQFWVVNNNFYYLYGLERAAVLHGLDKIGRHAWYPQGALWILEHQDPSGCWVTHSWDKYDEMVWNTWDTCFAILFLKRATRPLVSSEDRKSDR